MICVIFLILSGVFKALMDYCALSIDNRLFFNKDKSWILKYKQPLEEYTKNNWYYLYFLKPKYQEKFLYSSSFFISLTDGWHVFQSMFLTFMFCAIVSYTPIFSYILLDFIILRAIFGIVFQVSYFFINRK